MYQLDTLRDYTHGSLGTPLLSCGCNLVAQPRDALVHAFARNGVTARDMPRVLTDAIQLKYLHALDRAQRVRQVHLVREEEHGAGIAPDACMLQERLEFVLRHAHAQGIRAVDNKYDGLNFFVVLLPEAAVAALARHIEDGEVDVVLRERLHLEAYSRHDLSDASLFRFEVVDERGFARVVETDHDESRRATTEAERSRDGLGREPSRKKQKRSWKPRIRAKIVIIRLATQWMHELYGSSHLEEPHSNRYKSSSMSMVPIPTRALKLRAGQYACRRLPR